LAQALLLARERLSRKPDYAVEGLSTAPSDSRRRQVGDPTALVVTV